jgi:hypothetical protein
LRTPFAAMRRGVCAEPPPARQRARCPHAAHAARCRCCAALRCSLLRCVAAAALHCVWRSRADALR